MLVYIPYMDPMGYAKLSRYRTLFGGFASGFLRFAGSLPHGQAAKVTTNTSTSVNPATKPFIWCVKFAHKHVPREPFKILIYRDLFFKDSLTMSNYVN